MNATAGGAGLLPAGDFWSQPVAPADAGSMVQPASRPGLFSAALADPPALTLLVAGILLMLGTTLLRRRHRRRIGWGVLPDRTPLARLFAAGRLPGAPG